LSINHELLVVIGNSILQLIFGILIFYIVKTRANAKQKTINAIYAGKCTTCDGFDVK